MGSERAQIFSNYISLRFLLEKRALFFSFILIFLFVSYLLVCIFFVSLYSSCLNFLMTKFTEMMVSY
jgi:ABC-type lipoprotein release transport system permease subunit